MNNPSPDELLSAALVERWAGGDKGAQEQLFERLLPVIRRLARRRLSAEGRDLSLESRDLAHEASIQLMRLADRPIEQSHLMRLVARIVRTTCVDLVRERHALKRSGQKVSVSFAGASPEPDVDLLDLHEGILKLANNDEKAAELTDLRIFGGLSESEAAGALSISRSTATRKWQYAKLYLRKHLDK